MIDKKLVLSLTRLSFPLVQPRKTENYLSITCCAINGKKIMYLATKIIRGAVSLRVRIRKVIYFFPFSKFLSLVSFFRVRLSVVRG